jgi:hypothetical protein
MYSSWLDMYNQYLKNCEQMSEYFYGYGERLKAIYALFIEASQNFVKIDEQYRELFKASESTNALYKEYIDYFQKLNQQWIQYSWSPFLTQAQVKETVKIREKMED